ncbi:von Willebrand factor type A domain-containing protein [Pontimicrobium sp. SW4]|uniref:von Willebrand factor type A domain-containing protein n=1 Tax=Pontimicrobium sp. SW4 TaxID=3153519 RepID=A0AAU7BWE2_9FLAO
MKVFTTLILTAFITMSSMAQQKMIKGTVSDESGMPLPGVNIMIKGATTGTQSDFDGNYEILANVGDVLVFTYVGLKTSEQTVGASNTINVTMQEDAALLEEVIVTAYGYSRVNHKPTKAQLKRQKQKTYHNSITQALQGKVAGVQIRGTAVNTSKDQPLYIVDGVPIQSHYNSIIKNINSQDMDHINVYKGAKAKAVFGQSAKNGCIVITTKQGNYRIENQETYAQIDENNFERTNLAPLSTFSIDVDKASYSNIRRMINNGQRIPFDAVKIEEMVNYFDYNYPKPLGEHPFSINTEAAVTPWNSNTKIVKIGLQGKTYSNEELPPSNLTFLIDVSGSMNSDNKLPLLKSAFKLLVNQLREQDRVSIVVYAGAAGVVLKPTSGAHKEKILSALENLESGGSTAGGAGIELAYKLAQQNYKRKGNNRVILATDGDFNVGKSSDKAMEKLIEEKRKSGVYLSVLGFGYGNYKDSKLETLADKGNGNHAFIDTMQEAQKVFGKEFGGTLYTIAKDVKIQVEFNPNKVKAYRLIGYENRLLNDEDFIDDTKDAGELGSGHTVTALYEIIPVGVESEFLKEVDDLKYTKSVNTDSFSDELLTVKFRYKKPSEDKSIEMIHTLKDEVTESSEDLKFASSVALFGMHLRKSQYLNDSSIDDVLTLAKNSKGDDKDGYRAEFIRLVKATDYNTSSQ